MQKIRTGIIGGTGYTGIELLRLLSTHPAVDLVAITSRTDAGKAVSEVFTSLRGRCDLKFMQPQDLAVDSCDVVFFATPNGVAMQHAPELLTAGVRVIDLAADFRLSDVVIWEQWYGMRHHCPQLLADAVYGLPEVNRTRIKTARLVANPGCYPTAVQLGFLPLLEHDLVAVDSLIADAKSGVSGAGRSASLHTAMCEVNESFKAYSVAGHRHLPEIRQGLQRIVGRPVGLTFTPHLVPMSRGIFATLYARLLDPSISDVELQELFEQRYANEPFVDVMPFAAHPQTSDVRGANICRLALHRPQGGDMVVVLSAEDNLVKGAAGQAVQNMNLMFGLAESSGLEQIALTP